MKTLLFRLFRGVARLIGGRGLRLYAHPGLMRLYDRIYGRLRPSGIIPVKIGDSTLFFDSDVQSPLETLVISGTFEAFESEIFLSMIRPEMVVLDIGANVGYYTVIAVQVLLSQVARISTCSNGRWSIIASEM